MSKQVLGIDVGGVIIDRVKDKGTGTGFYGGNFRETTAVPHIFPALSLLRQKYFGPHIHIVSKCGPDIEHKTLLWMRHHDFYLRTGVPPGRVHFCRTRAGKAPICRKLGITHFVDDRLEVLSYLTTVRHRFLLNPDEKEVGQYQQHLPNIVRAEDWVRLTVEIVKRSEILNDLL